MQCPKCNGLMLIYFFYSETELEEYPSARCMICGNRIDEVILHNRTIPLEQLKEMGRVPGNKGKVKVRRLLAI